MFLWRERKRGEREGGNGTEERKGAQEAEEGDVMSEVADGEGMHGRQGEDRWEGVGVVLDLLYRFNLL